LVYAALADTDAEVHSNAAYAAGRLVEFSENDLSSRYLQILTALRPHFTVAPEAPVAKFNARDNAAGAVARLILKNTAAVPLDQVLPGLVTILPLRNDFQENTPLFQALFHLFRTQHAIIMPYIDALLPVFSHVLDPANDDQLSTETRGELIQLITALNGEIPAKIEGAGLKLYVV